MIAYHAPYSSKLGRAPFLGQDAVITPVAPAPAAMPDPEPTGQQVPVSVPPPPAPPAPQAPASKEWTVSIGGKSVSGWTLVLSALVITGGIALVVFTKEDIDAIYARKTT